MRRTLYINAVPLELGVKSGVGRYVYEIVQRLPLLLPDWEIILASRNPTLLPKLPASLNVRGEAVRAFRRIKPGLWSKFRASVLLSENVGGVIWNPALPAIGGVGPGWRTVLTVHDIVWRLYPETMGWGQRLLLQACAAGDLHRAGLLAAVSNGTKSRAQDAIPGISFAAIIPPAVDHEVFFPRAKTFAASRYLLTVGTLEPRKNLREVIRAFSQVRLRPGFEDLTLKVVGGRGWGGVKPQQALGVQWVGAASDALLADLYQGCVALLQCSLYEGYGMPVAEAVACGAPVIITDMPELREAVGNGTFVATAPNAAAIAAAIDRLLGLPIPSRSAPARSWSWAEAAQAYAQLFQRSAEATP